MGEPKYVTIMFVPDGAQPRRGLRVRQWLVRLAGSVLVLVILGMIVFFSTYSGIIGRAAMTDRLREENERLKQYYYKVQLLEQNLIQTRQMVGRMAELAGIDFEFPQLPDDETIFEALDKPHQAVVERPGIVDLTIPSGLPVQGFISQDFNLDDPNHYHPGIDIACSEGTPILATAAGVVSFAAFDSTYGFMVVVRHSDTITTLYGHNDSLLVEVDQAVSAGSRLALSGSTGQSTAPHLHYEVRINDKPIDPLREH
ncbi:MAG: M23 family metallopeptidase [candidate division Zixibacteria bacterium]|nr:M23 family metallopeptidase [candidate division Zixibacteria bacterium]